MVALAGGEVLEYLGIPDFWNTVDVGVVAVDVFAEVELVLQCPKTHQSKNAIEAGLSATEGALEIGVVAVVVSYS